MSYDFNDNADELLNDNSTSNPFDFLTLQEIRNVRDTALRIGDTGYFEMYGYTFKNPEVLFEANARLINNETTPKQNKKKAKTKTL